MLHSAIALVNTGSQHTPAIEARYLAMASGTRAADTGGGVGFYEPSELIEGRPAGEVHAEQMGVGQVLVDSAVCIGFPKLLRANDQPAFRAESIGLVGDAFHKAGLRTAVIGNSDVPDRPQRLGPLLAMDSKGIVDTGIIGADALTKDARALCGIRDDPEKLLRLTMRMLQDHSLVVVELGDLNRLEALKGDISDHAYTEYRHRCLQNIDEFLGNVAGAVQYHKGTLILCSPVRDQRRGYWSNLSPMLMFGRGADDGLLVSATARTPGLLSNIDIGPTIIQAAGLPVPDFVTGRPARSVSADHPVERLQRMERIATRNYALQIMVLVGAVAVPTVLLATLSEIVLRRRSRRWARQTLRSVMPVVLAMPAALLLTDGWEGSGLPAYALHLAMGAAIVLAVSWIVSRGLTAIRRGKPVSTLGVMMVVTAAFISLDQLTGARLLRWSIVSCDQITGIRYYGLGNEYMGLLIVTTLMGVLLLMRDRARAAKECVPVPLLRILPAALWFAFVAFITGYPRVGANVGGLLTAVPTFGVAIMVLMGVRIRARHVGGLLALAFVAVAGCAVVDTLSPGASGSHLGRSIELARIYGWDWLGYLIGGKLLMHLGILRLPQTYWPLLCGIPFFVMYGGRMKSETAEAGKTDLLYRVGVPSVLVGMATAFLFNDSGIVPAMLMFANSVLVLQYLRLEEG